MNKLVNDLGMDGVRGEPGDQGPIGERGDLGPVIKGEKGK